MSVKKWTEEKIRAESAKYSTRSEWAKSSGGSYNAATLLGIREECCANMPKMFKAPRKWTDEAIFTEALKYDSKFKWRKGSKGSYSAALTKSDSFFKYCTAHMPKRNSPGPAWDIKNIKEIASKYESRTEWALGDPNSYAAARRQKAVDLCSEHMDRKTRSGKRDNDAVYIWKALGEYYNGLPVYKIGVTSIRLGFVRVNQCAKRSNFDPQIILVKEVECRATLVEKEILSLGLNPNYIRFDGSTEFRAMTDDQLQRALDIINEHATDDDLLAA